MNSLTRISAAIALATLLSACATQEKGLQEQGLKQLNNEELRSMHARDRTLTYVAGNGSAGTGKFNADGKISLSWGNGSDEGTWRISEDRLCTTYKNVIRPGAERCFAMYRSGDNKYELVGPDGMITSTVSFTN